VESSCRGFACGPAFPNRLAEAPEKGIVMGGAPQNAETLDREETDRFLAYVGQLWSVYSAYNNHKENVLVSLTTVFAATSFGLAGYFQVGARVGVDEVIFATAAYAACLFPYFKFRLIHVRSRLYATALINACEAVLADSALHQFSRHDAALVRLDDVLEATKTAVSANYRKTQWLPRVVALKIRARHADTRAGMQAMRATALLPLVSVTAVLVSALDRAICG